MIKQIQDKKDCNFAGSAFVFFFSFEKKTQYAAAQILLLLHLACKFLAQKEILWIIFLFLSWIYDF